MTKTYFITGTDTGVGKTLVTASLMVAAGNKNYSTLGLKPLAAGCEVTKFGLRNSDALQLMASASIKLSYEMINPVALHEPIAPHIAAELSGQKLTVAGLVKNCKKSMSSMADFCLVEGAGGWRVPLNKVEYMSDFAKSLGCPVIMVVGLKLGCLNHAVLTADSILADGVELAGYIVSCVDKQMTAGEDNIRALRDLLPVPEIGLVPFLDPPSPEIAEKYLNIDKLI